MSGVDLTVLGNSSFISNAWLFGNGGSIAGKLTTGNLTVTTQDDAGFDISSSTVIKANANILFNSNAVNLVSTSTLSGNSGGTSTFTFREYGDNAPMEIGGTSAGNAWQLTNAEIATIQPGFASIIFGNAAQSAAINVTASPTFSSPVTFITNGTANVTTVANTTITATNKNLTLSAPVTAAGSLTLNAGTGTITTGSTISAGANNLTLTADDLALGGNLSGTAALAIKQKTSGRNIYLNGTGTGLTLSNTEIGYLVDGWSSITFGDAAYAATSTIYHGGNGAITWYDPIILNTYAQIHGAFNGTDNASFSSPNRHINAYADITTSGQSIPDGSIGIFDYSLKPQVGKVVLVRLGDVYTLKIVRRIEGKLYLTSGCKGYPVIPIDEDEGVEIKGVLKQHVVEHD